LIIRVFILRNKERIRDNTDRFHSWYSQFELISSNEINTI
jgi:hypothetical protein